MHILRHLAALAGLMLAAAALSSSAQTTGPAKALPTITFTAPGDAASGADRHEWMLQPGYRKALNKQLLALTRAQDTPLRTSAHFAPARDAIARYFDLGPDYAYVKLLEDNAIYLSYGRLFMVGEIAPLFDPARHSAFAVPTLEGFTLSPSGRTLAISVGDGGSEIAEIHFLDLESRERLGAVAGPVVVGGDTGFAWLSDELGAYRRAATTDLVQGDPSIGAEWTLFDLATGQSGASVFGEAAQGVSAEFGDWFGIWVPEASNKAMGYLWRGNFIDAYITDLADLMAGTPTWQPVAPEMSLTDVELWNDQLLITATDQFGRAGLYTQPAEGGHIHQIARGNGETTYLYSISLGPIAYVAARQGDAHALYRISDDALTLEPVALPFRGEIDFESFFTVEGTPGSVTFDMSSPDAPWRLFRLDATGPAYPLDYPGLVTRNDPAATDGIAHTLEFASSADGARVPVSIIAKAEAPLTPAPTIVHAYGSYGETTMAGWNPRALSWVSLGGVWAECHVRGSGFYGPAWHAEGSGPDKARSRADMVACAEHLAKRGHAEPGRIAALGGSAGGLVAGPVSINRPDLFGAAIIEFGVVNPLRGLDGPNGATQIDEFGDPRLPEDAALMALSDSVELARTAPALPDMYLCVGMQDSRVPHWMSARLAATMAERDLGAEIVLDADLDAGHSCGFYAEDQRDAIAKQFAWLMDRFSE